MTANKELDVATAWRAEYDCLGRGGLIIISRGIAEGWMDRLRNPEGWTPGCIAVADDGRSWTAIAGNDWDGALMWLPNEEIPD